MKQVLHKMLLALIVVALVLSVAPAPRAQAVSEPQVDFWLTLLHNNDGESDLLNLGTGLEDFGGVARFKTLVDMLKHEALFGETMSPGRSQGVVMVSSGDNFLAGPEFNVSQDLGMPLLDGIALDLIGYDALALGNHDFDFGPDVTANLINSFERTRPVFLSANLDFRYEPDLARLVKQKRLAASTVVIENRQRIGIIGATTPMLPFISSPRNVIVNAMVAEAINAQVDILMKKRVNKIILISHLQSIEEDLELISMLRGVDIVVAGGGDEILANEGDLLVPGDQNNVYGPYPMMATDTDGKTVPVVTTAGNYSYVGKLVVGFDWMGNLVAMDTENSGPVRVANTNQEGGVADDPEMVALVVDPLNAGLAELAANVIGTSEVGLNGVRTDIRSVETNLGNLASDAMLWQARQLAAAFGVPSADVALQNGGGIRNNNIIPAGPVTELNTFSILPFTNFVSVVENVSRETFKEILENAVSRVEFGDGRFAQIAGFSFEWTSTGTVAQVIDLNGVITTPGTRVRNVVLDDGTVIVADGSVVPGPALTVATIDFLARGGDQYPFGGVPFTTLGVTYQQVLANYIQDGLGGLISAADYPEGGEGRTVRLP